MCHALVDTLFQRQPLLNSRALIEINTPACRPTCADVPHIRHGVSPVRCDTWVQEYMNSACIVEYVMRRYDKYGSIEDEHTLSRNIRGQLLNDQVLHKVLFEPILHDACDTEVQRYIVPAGSRGCFYWDPTQPLLSPAEAVALVRRGDRSAGALTYGWPTRAHPDPTGERLAILRRALVDHPHIEAIFWE